jgi:hypothetical protein
VSNGLSWGTMEPRHNQRKNRRGVFDQTMGRLSDKTSAPIVSTLDLSANRSEPEKAIPVLADAGIAHSSSTPL